MTDSNALKTELATDFAALGYAGKGDVDIAALINAQNPKFSVRQPVVPVWRLLAWAAQNGRFAAIQTEADAGTKGVKSIALAAMKVFGTVADFDVDDAGAKALLGAMVQAGVLTADDQTAFAALGDRSPASRAEVLWGPGTVVSHTDVAIALRGF